MPIDGAGTLHQHGERHMLRFERRYQFPVERVWRAISDEDEMSEWFPARMESARRSGAKIHFVDLPEPGESPSDAPEKRGATSYGELLVWDPPHVLEFTWDDETLRFTLASIDGGTELVFTHSYRDLAKSARDAAGWTVCLDALSALLDGRPSEPFTQDRFDSLFAEYATQFGAAGSKKKAPDGW